MGNFGLDLPWDLSGIISAKEFFLPERLPGCCAVPIFPLSNSASSGHDSENSAGWEKKEKRRRRSSHISVFLLILSMSNWLGRLL